MSLETRISEMSDPGQFEKLATEILRRSNDRYKDVIQTGINVEGKPIKDPVDGLGQVPDSDLPHYVFLEFTTSQKVKLEKKWLANPDSGNSQSKGDLLKAAEQADKIRENVSDAEFTVILVSNRVLDSELVRATYGTANAYDLSVDIWGVHRLRNFLETDPDGQYIRKKYFGIEEERLSKPLLLELSDRSLESYKEQFHIRIGEAKIERPQLSTILDRAHSSSVGSYFVPIVGNSGFGKTVTSYQAMEQWIASGKPGIRLDSNDIEDAKSLGQAIQSGLSRLHSSLEPTAGRTALQLAKNNQQLLVIVDDLNRADNPSQLLARLQHWMGGAQEQSSGTSEDEVSSFSNKLPITILCPLWPRIWNRQERNITRNQFAEAIEIGPLSIEMATRLVEKHASTQDYDIDEEEAREFAEKLGRDPHLIGLLGRLMNARTTIRDLPDTSKDVLYEYTEYAYETATENSDEPLIVPDYERAVEELSLDVMKARNMEPIWKNVSEWSQSGSGYLHEIRILSQQEQLFTILKRQMERVLSFRHDRIRDFLLATASLNEIQRNDEAPAYLGDPYYHSILGTGISYYRPSRSTLSELCKQNPLSLLKALRRLGGEAPEYEAQIKAEFQRWFDQQSANTELPDSLLGEAMEILQETNSDQTLEIAKLLPQYPAVLLARFRNGDLEAGIRYCNNDFGSPFVNNTQRESVFNEVIPQQEDQYTEDLAKILSSIDDENVQGALHLAGFLGRSELGPSLKDCWSEHQDNPKLLPAFLWATFQCCIPEHYDLVNQVFERWASLPSGSSAVDQTDEITKGRVYSRIKFALIQDVTEEQSQYLIEAVERYPDLGYHLPLLLSRVPHPDAVELVVKKRGENLQEIDGMSPWATHLLDNWSPDRLRGQDLPKDAKQRMKSNWTDENNDREVRKSAFQLWARNAEIEDIDELKRASKNALFEYPAHYYRLKLGDETAVTSSSIDIIENSGLLEALPNAWCTKAYELVDGLMSQHPIEGSGDLSHHVGSLLFQIPDDDAENLLDKHWESVSNHPRFFQAALYTTTTQMKELVEKTYADSDNPSSLLNHLSMNFGFNTYGQSQLITEQHLHTIEPYLSDLDDMDLIDIAEKANEMGMRDWGANHVQPHLSDEWQQTFYPTDEDLKQEFNEIESEDNSKRETKGWMLRFERRSISQSYVFQILDEWLQTDPTIDRYQIVTEIIKEWGTRDELAILEDISLSTDRTQKLYRDAEFRVKSRTIN